MGKALRWPQMQELRDGEIYSIIHNGIRLAAWGDPNKDPDNSKLVIFITHLPN